MKRMIGGKVWDTEEMFEVTEWVSTSDCCDIKTKLLYDEKSGFSFFANDGLDDDWLYMIENVQYEVENFLEKYNVEISPDVEYYLKKISS